MGTTEGALEHKTRRMIYNYVHNHPGVSSDRIRSIFGLNDSTLRYHIAYLEKGELLTSKQNGKDKCYFCSDEGASDPLTGAELMDMTVMQRRIASLIKGKPGITRKDILESLKVDRKTLSQDLRRLEESKVVWKTENNGSSGYEYITKERLRKMMYRRLLQKLLDDDIDEATFRKLKERL